jgi:hypothetical protein
MKNLLMDWGVILTHYVTIFFLLLAFVNLDVQIGFCFNENGIGLRFAPAIGSSKLEQIPD